MGATETIQEPRFIVVDDDKPTLFLVGWILSQSFAGGQIASFDDGVPALEYLRHNRADVLITDQRMRLLDGDELIHQIRELGVHISTVMISSSPYAEEAAAAAGVRFVPKDKVKTRLVEAVRDLLMEARASSS